MPIKKWLRQYAVALPVLTGIFTLSQYSKGYTLTDAVEFALYWALVTLAIFAVSRAWNFHRHQYCGLCKDLPAAPSDDKSN
ncbi:hypothetical protein BFC17_10705 [Alteromonas lipolytica]|uniref:Uncharacterized protein n=2 Tax=Alteromonas lipolytica TaxID=1856405 RepID=A0A1E8FJF3_9ALTE|nr:hypothetical protein BFC17_10705 [Alteromonas lipolytica]